MNEDQPSVLVACPTAEMKDYALERYLSAYRRFDYENKDLFMVDTTRDDDGLYYRRLLSLGINSIHISVSPPNDMNPYPACNLVTEVWPHILQEAWEKQFDYVLSIEVDVICPENTISLMVDVAKKTNAVHVAHDYNLRGGSARYFGVGLNLFKRTDYRPDFESWGPSWHNFEGYAHHICTKNNLSYVQLFNVLKPLEHLDA